jgi:hypothetical protein
MMRARHSLFAVGVLSVVLASVPAEAGRNTDRQGAETAHVAAPVRALRRLQVVARPFGYLRKAPAERARPITDQLSNLPEVLVHTIDQRHWSKARQGASPAGLAEAYVAGAPAGKALTDHTGLWSRHESNHAQEASREAKRMLKRVTAIGWEEPIHSSVTEIAETSAELIAAFHDAFMSDPYGRAEHRPRGAQEVFQPGHDEGFRALSTRPGFGKKIQEAFGLNEQEAALFIKEATALCAIHDVKVARDIIWSPKRLREYMQEQLLGDHVPAEAGPGGSVLTGRGNVLRHYGGEAAFRKRAYSWLDYAEMSLDHPHPAVRARVQVAKAIRASAFALRTGDGFRDRGTLMKGHDDADFLLSSNDGDIKSVIQVHDYATGRRHFATRNGDPYAVGEVNVKELEVDDHGNLVVTLSDSSLHGDQADKVAYATAHPIVDSIVDLKSTYPGADKMGIVIRTEGYGRHEVATKLVAHLAKMHPEAKVTRQVRRAPRSDGHALGAEEDKRFQRAAQLPATAAATLKHRLASGGLEVSNLRDADVVEALSHARTIQLQPGDVLMQEGAQDARYVYVAVGGNSLHSSRTQGRDYFVADGALLGVEPVVSPDSPRLETIKAEKPVTVIAIPAEKAQKLLYPGILGVEPTMRYMHDHHHH